MLQTRAQGVMTSARQPAADAPATLSRLRGRDWWPVSLAIVVATLLHVAMPGNTGWIPQVVPAVLLALLAALIPGTRTHDRQRPWLRISRRRDRLPDWRTCWPPRLFHDILTTDKLFATTPRAAGHRRGVWVTT